MAITSIGYDGSISEVPWATFAPHLSARYWVQDEGSWAVTAKPGASWTVNIAAGTGGGDGVRDTSDDIVEIPLPSPTGAPWHVIYMDRDWAGAGGTSQFDSMPATSDGNIPSDLLTAQDPGNSSKQPIALVQLVEGQTQPSAIVDLRVWQANGNAVASSSKVTQYLTDLGTQITVGSTVWTRVLALGVAVWTSHQTTMSPLALFGAGLGLAGGAAPSSGGFKIQAGTQVAVTDPAGYARITFPTPFPGGLLTIVLTDGDTSVDRAAGEILHFGVAGTPWNTGNRTDVVYAVMRPRASWTNLNTGSITHRVNWIAIGW